MTLSWDADDERVVIEVFPFTEAAVVDARAGRRGPRGARARGDASWSGSPPATARAFVQARRAGRRGRPARAARSAATRSTRTATCACGPTASAAATRDRTVAAAGSRRASWSSTAGSCRPPTPPSSARSTGSGVVYKPVAGERPLWDFPDGTLADREVAAYLVSEATRLGRRAADLAARRARTARAWCSCWQEPDADAGGGRRSCREGEVPPGYLHVFDGVDGRDRPVALVHEDTARAAPDGGLRRRRQQRRPQGRPRAGDGRRSPLRRRPRRHLPHRRQAAHRAVGLGRRAADRRGGGRRSRRGRATALDGELGDALGGAPHRRSRSTRVARRCDRLLRPRARCPAPRGELAGHPVAALLTGTVPARLPGMRSVALPRRSPTLPVTGPAGRASTTPPPARRGDDRAPRARPGSTSAGSRRTTPPTWATPRRTSPSTCSTGPGATPATR